jgi:hypothetical protein
MTMTVSWDVAIVLITGAVNISETSVYFYETTRRNVQENSRLHTRRLRTLNITGVQMFSITFICNVVRHFSININIL